MLQRVNAKAKARRYNHHIPHSFQIGDHVWLHLNKERFTGPYRKMEPLWYGPYSILKNIGENVFQLGIPVDLGLHPVFNVNLLRPYHAPLLEHNDLHTTKPKYIHSDVQEPLPCDTIVWWRIHHTRTNSIPLFQVAKARQIPTQGKWYSSPEVANKFPHLNKYTMDTIVS